MSEDRDLLGRRRLVASVAITAVHVALGWSRVGPAMAHAIVVESEPANGARLDRSPPAARVRFNSKIERRLSRLSLVGPDRRPIPLAVDGAGDRPDRLVAPLPPLQRGAYAIRWRVLATDGHITEGMIRFTVEPAS
jgi:methionine-rich copper-binding protein CopC